MRDNSSLYFWLLKVLHLHVPNQTKHNYDSQRSRSVLMIGLCWLSNAGRLPKWNTWSKPPSHRPLKHFRVYFLFIMTWDACMDVWDSHTDVNWHLVILGFFGFWKFGQFNLLWWRPYYFDPFRIFAILYCGFFWCVAVLMLESPEYLWWVGL